MQPLKNIYSTLRKIQVSHYSDTIFTAIENTYGISRYRVNSRARQRVLIDLRSITYKILQSEGATELEISKVFKLDRSTIHNGLVQFGILVTNDEDFKYMYDEIFKETQDNHVPVKATILMHQNYISIANIGHKNI